MTKPIARGTVLFFLTVFGAPLYAEPSGRPNILFIVADDMGYSDIGTYGGEIATPVLDRLASEGIRLSNFHVLPTCAPTRSVLLTGNDNHIAGIGGQRITEKQLGQPGYEGHLSPSIPTLAEVLGNAGYATFLSGKWHLGAEPGRRPFDRGFQQTFSLLTAGASHFSDAAALGLEEPVSYSRNGQLVEALPDDFYSTRNYTDEMLSFLDSKENVDQPFFAYLAFTAPHDPLHAPEDYIAKYKGSYDDGYEVLREQRFMQARKKGVLPDGLELGDWPSIVNRWDSLSEDDKAMRRRDMETYAAMVDFMDAQIGRVIQWLEDNKQLDNTLVLFFSDNGANALSATVYPGHDATYHSRFDNSLGNRGLRGSFTHMGAGWATASSAGFRLFKVFVTEGGIRAPAIIRPPGGAAGEINRAFVHVQDVMPSVLDLAGVRYPTAGNENIRAMTGRSHLPLFSGDATYAINETGVGYELHGTRAYFKDKWKILQMPIPLGSGEWELFDLEADPGERYNLARQEPDVLADLVKQHQAYEQNTGVVYDLSGPILALTTFAKVIVYSLLFFAVMSAWLARRSSSKIVFASALAQLAGVIFLIAGIQNVGVILLVAGSVGILWHSIGKKYWYGMLVALLIVILTAVLLFLRSGRAVTVMLG